MTLNERNSKRKGMIGSLLFHILLIISFLFMGLKYQDPPPAEEGISINFGFIDEGSGDIEPEQTDKTIEIVEEESVEEQIESKENIIVQSEIESPILEKVKEEKKIIQNEKKNEGFVIKPARTNSIAARIAAVEKFLTRVVDGKYGVVIDPESGSSLVKCLAGKYRYKINTKGVKDEKPEKSHPWSDIADAFQYLCLHADGGEVFGSMTVANERREIKHVSAGGWT